VWSALNPGLCAAFELALGVLGPLPEWAQLALLGAPAALLALGVFRAVSDQDGLERAKQRIQAHLLELLLYRNDLRVTLGAQRAVLWHNLVYLRHAALPLLILAGPFALLVLQVEAHYAHRSLLPGETALLAVELASDDRSDPVPELEALPDGLALDAPPVRIPRTREAVWRLRALRPGDYAVAIRLGPSRVEKRVQVGTHGRALAPVLWRTTDPRALTAPGEPALPEGSPALSVRVAYPLARSRALNLSSATWIFTAAALAWGFALRRPLGVRL